MFLTHRKGLSIFLCLISAVLLSAGIVLWEASAEIRTDNGAEIYDTTAAERYETEAISSPLTQTTDEPLTTMPYSTEPAETALPSSESEKADTVQEENNADTESDSKSTALLQRTLSIILTVSGAAMSLIFIICGCRKAPILGPELELLASGAAIYAFLSFDKALNPAPFLKGLVYFALFEVLLICLRGLRSFASARLDSTWCLSHRIANAVFPKRTGIYIAFQFIWSAAALSGIAALAAFAKDNYMLLYPLAVCVISFAMAATKLLKAAFDTEHLASQIDCLIQGNETNVRKGAFEEAERSLIDLGSQRDEAVRAAIAGERFKVELISNVSHDLRTPLTAILGYGELLKKENLSPEGQDQLIRLNQKAGYMRELVDSLFELTKVSSGEVEAKRDRIDLIRLLEQTVGLFDERLAAARLKIKRQYPDRRAPIVSDGARLHRVFANLIGNAAKYALPGTRVHLIITDEDTVYRVRITNVASYEMDFQADEITERFARGDKARSTEGSGLGLAIAKTYAESVGGSFFVTVDGEQFSAVTLIPKNA